MHVEKIAKTPHSGRRAFTNIFAVIGALIESILVLAPQPPDLLGVELIVLNLSLLLLLMVPLIRSWIETVAGFPPLRLLGSVSV